MSETHATAKHPTWVRQVVDFGALAAFAAVFLFFRLRGMPGSEALVQATWGLVAGSAVAIAVGLLVEKRLALMPLLVGGFALVFGVLTLVFQDDLFVKLKVTVLNASLAVALLGGVWLKKEPLKALLGSVIPVNDRAWRILTIRYGFFFAAVAIVNELVRSEALVGWATGRLGMTDVDPADVWVSFRGVLWIASSAFGLANVPLIMKNLVSDAPVDATAPIEPEVMP
ncbi:putative intracellular septation protein A [Brevundimonas sp. NIBR10]|uniref:inner membrane-spanning protein YciB n=1 Tax=Brevundimonas sp. NIBR10 TaxID=3015997 RepID=UPI0022F17B67|nr:septation protein IspZ [Brevundimonas sp. NIBR10]WGM45325.1 putative intracellular septation protein A [Brevundimonas sp. NIBR10]